MEEKATNKSKQSLKITLSVGVVLLILTLSYGFLEGISLLPYLTPKFGAAASKLELTYSDCSSNKQADCEDISADLEPGDSISKTFEVKNTGTVTLSYNLMFKEILNTFKNDELVYKIENLDDDTLVVPNDTPVPYVETKEDTRFIKGDIEIQAGKRHRYKVTVTFLNKDYNQTENESAVFNLKMGVSGNETYEITFDPNGGSVETTTKTVTYGELYGELPTPTYEGYVFAGWYTNAEGGIEVTDGSRVNSLSNTTLYAHWEVKTVISDIIAKAKKGNPNFAEPATTDEGVYSLEDDYGTSYYFRGASQNNYIKYGKNKDGQDMYWRIVRINGDGSLRIIYDGTQAYANGTDNNDRYAKIGQVWNTQYDDAKYVGYMFGGAQGVASTSKEEAQANETNSEAKTAVDTWYKENIVDTGYGSNVVDAIFCNDRSTPGKSATGWSRDTGLGYGNNYTAYGATARTGVWKTNNIAPKFTCEVKNDAFTVNESDKGNGKLTYPVGLITADEIMAAGSGKYGAGANQSYYLHKSSSYFGWLLSPYSMGLVGRANVFIVNYNGGYFYDTYTHNASGAIAPVINLSYEYASTLTGDGSMTNPYREQE